MRFNLDDQGTPEQHRWRARGRCRGLGQRMTSMFFSEDVNEILRAKSICERCSVRRECLAAAAAQREPWGVWGGELFVAGQVRSKLRPRGRPPHRSRPPVMIDEVPVPPDLMRA